MQNRKILLVLLSGIVSFISFPPFHFGLLIFIALVPLLYSIEDVSPKKAFKYGYIWGMIFYLGLIYYIAWVTVPGMIATVLVLSLIPAFGSMVFERLLARNRWIAIVFVPLFFVAVNWLFTMSELNYPWCDFGYALDYYLIMIQAADLGGVYLISILILFFNMIIYVSISPKFEMTSGTQWKLRSGSLLIVAFLLVYGGFRLSGSNDKSAGNSLKVGMIQSNMTEDLKWDPQNLQMNFDRHFALSRKAVSQGASFLVWPETAIPAYILQEKQKYYKIKAFVDSLNVPILTGIPYYETVGPNQYIYFNSAALLKPYKEGYTLYSKVHLVPVSERIPFSDRFKILKDIHLGQADFSSGREQTVFSLNGFKFATLICFESAFPGYCRDFAKKGAQFFVVITNDMWFGRTSLMEQHAMMSVFRAVENRIPVVRAGNTGVSMAVNKWGRILTKSDIFKELFITAEISPIDSKSIYGVIGDIIPKIAAILTFLALVIAFWPGFKYLYR